MATTVSPRTSALTADEIIEFYERGFLRPGRILDEDQVEKLKEALARSRQMESQAGREYDLLDPAIWPTETRAPQEPGKTMGYLHNLWLYDNNFREVSFNPILARWASQLVGARQVRLLEDNALYKEPRSGGQLKWHQDFPYWPVATPNEVTAWIALDRVTKANGAMSMAVGSHLLGERLPAAFGTGVAFLQDKRPKVIKAVEDPEKLGLDIEVCELGPGEVSFHHSLTLHASGPNETDNPRRAVAVRYVGDGAIWLGSRRYEYNYTDEQVGILIGEPVGGRLFPIIPF